MTKTNPDAVYLLPTRAQIASLKVGDQALNCFGRMSEVVEIAARKDDIHGYLFVCYYTRDAGQSGSTSMSMKEGELVRTVALSCLHKSAELDAIERDMRAAGAR